MKLGVVIFMLFAQTGTLPASDFLPVVTLEKKGVFHEPVPGAELKRFEIPIQSGLKFEQIVVELDVTHAGWRARGEKKTNHAIFWLNRGRKWRGNVLGYVNVFGPTRPRVKMANNIGKAPRVMSAQTLAWEARPGIRYHFRYVYDARQGRVELTVEEGGKVASTLRGKVPVAPIASTPPGEDASSGFFIVFGHPAGSPGPEVPTYGWTYANLKVVLSAGAEP